MVPEVHDGFLTWNATCQSLYKGRVDVESLSEAKNPFIEDAQDAYASPPV